eukprot:g14040.t1
MFAQGEVAPLADTPEQWRGQTYPLFFATDRQFQPDTGKAGQYSHLRSDRLELGLLQISLGDQLFWSDLDAATQAKPGGKRPRPQVIAIDRRGTMPWMPAGQPEPVAEDQPERSFIEALEAAVQQSIDKEITIYIHGFKNSFEEAALTAAELGLYSGGLGPFVLYSWPSYDSLFEYSHDRDSVRYTTAHARRFVELLANEIAAGRLSASKINLIAHSSGAEVVGSILRELGLMSHTWTPKQRQQHWRIGEVLMVAPDISTDVARERILKEDLRGMYDRLVVYTSTSDSALRWASSVLYRVTRIGSIREQNLTEADRRWIRQARDLTLINIDEQPSGDPVRHSHHRYSGATLSDMLLCLRSDLSPSERGLVRTEEEVIWRFADDYEDRVTEAAIKDNIYFTAGLHPHYAEGYNDKAALLDALREKLADPNCVALGEMGLDRHYPDPPFDLQQRVFEWQLEPATDGTHAGPIIIHNREATDDTLAILTASGVAPSRFVFHCFTGTANELEQVLAFGAMVSLTGIVTFGSAKDLAQASDAIPLDRLMIETDSPYLTPAPHRKVRPNEPRYVADVARFLANRRSLSLETFTAAVDANAQRERDPAEAEYREKFGKAEREVRQTKATNDDADFAKRLLTEADSGDHSPGLTLLLYVKAYEAGSRDKSGFTTATQALDKLREKDETRVYEVAEMRVALLEKWYEEEPNRDRKDAEAFIDHCLNLSRGAIESGESDRALKLLNRVNRFATRTDSPRKNDIRDSISDLIRNRKTLEEIAELEELLGTEPTAADQLAMIYLAHLDDPDKATLYAHDMQDAALAAKILLAATEFTLATPQDANQAGLFYYSLVTEDKSREPIAMLIRARVWLTEFLSRDELDKDDKDTALAIQTARETLGEIDAELLKRGIGKKLRRKMSSLLRGEGQFDRPADIQAAIDKGVQWLYSVHNDQKHWDKDTPKHRNWGGYTAIVVYALLMADEDPKLNGDLSRAVYFMMNADMTGTYARCFRIHAWEVMPRRERYRQTLMQDVAWMRRAGTQYGLWGYTVKGNDVNPGTRADLSTTLAGGLGLWIGEAVGGVTTKKVYWERTARILIDLQLDDNGWSYNPYIQKKSTGSMTAAALTLLYASYPHLGEVTKKKVDEAIDRGMLWMDENFSASNNVNRGSNKCYYFAAVQHLGLFSSRKDFRGMDWYDSIAEHLVKSQAANGAWGSAEETAFAIAFLCRGGITYESESENALEDEDDFGGSESESEPEPETRPRTLLVGTALAIRQLGHTLVIARPLPEVIGCILPATAIAGDAASELPCKAMGSIEQLETIVSKSEPDLVLVSLPLAMHQAIGRTAATLGRLGVTWRFMPTLDDQLAGRTTSRITGGLPTSAAANQGLSTSSFVSGPIDPTRLIDRSPRPLDEQALAKWIGGRRVLITGAGGSIGSELARVVARFSPARLTLLERSENALFEIDRELARTHTSLQRSAVLHDVTQRDRTFDVLKREQPDVVLHAAAHKHVPMMEDHPAAAIENNFYGTRAIADATAAVGAERFVMISTDKAVNPSSVMGASKRLAELYVQHLNTVSDTACCMVRFGNVLGSACSVVPIWTKQLEDGGPVTVTHEDMTRYFMTIPEAAGLVLQAGMFSGTLDTAMNDRGGEVFLLDMGDPIRILDLARRFVRLQGFEPDVDVEIRIIGTRPGEKLFEELAYTGEDMLPTPHDSIRVWKNPPPTAAQIQSIIDTFDRLRNKTSDPDRNWRDATESTIITALRAAVPEMIHAAAV